MAPTRICDIEDDTLLKLKSRAGGERIFSRFEKLDVMYVAFIHCALIVEALR